MTEQELLQDLNDAEAQLTLWQATHSSPGYAHLLELLATFKASPMEQQLFCVWKGWDQVKLNEALATIGNVLLLGDKMAASAPRYAGLIDKAKKHDFLLKIVANNL